MASAPLFVVGIDQGTTSTRAFQLLHDGEFVPLCGFSHRQFYPQAGWFEHDPRELLSSLGQCLDYATGAAGVGLGNQGGTVVIWDTETGEPLYNAIVWNDIRTRDTVEQMGAKFKWVPKRPLDLFEYLGYRKSMQVSIAQRAATWDAISAPPWIVKNFLPTLRDGFGVYALKGD